MCAASRILIGMGLVLLPEAGAAQSRTRVDLALAEGTNVAAALSPDGRTIALDLLGAIWTMPSAGGAATRITDEMGDARQPAWSADGRAILFQSYRDGNWHIWRVPASGGPPTQLSFGPFDDREPHGSPDGRRIAFSSDRGGSYDIWELDVETGALRQVTQAEGNEWGPAWSPNGAEIAYATDGGILALDATGRTRRLANADGTLSAPAWTPDGATVVFHAALPGRTELRRGADVVVANEDVFPFRAQWVSPTEILYTADGKVKRRVLGAAASTLVEFSARVAFDRVPYERRKPEPDARGRQPARGIVAPVISPDGRTIAFSALGDLWTMPVGGAPRRITQDAFVDNDPAWSPDGTQLAFTSDRAGTPDLWIRDLRTGTDRQLTNAATAEVRSRWSPDGKWLAFQDNEGRISLVEVASGAVRPLHRGQTAPTLFAPGRPTWSADSRTVAFTALQRYSTRFREGTSQILYVDVETGAERRADPVPHHSIGRREEDGPVWSPDGSKMAFVMDGTLWVLPVERDGTPAGAPYRLTDELAEAPSWTGDSQRILYQSARGLRLISVVDGRTADVALALDWERPPMAERVVVHAARVFDGVSPDVRRNVDIVVENGRIARIEAHRAELHAGRVVDAGQGTVMPGLIEMHTHMSDDYGEPLGKLWLAYGVTSVREPAGNPWRAVERREAIESGVRVGPRIFTTGYTLDGSRIYYSGSTSIGTGPQLEREVERLASLGLDVAKTYVRLPDPLQARAVEAAHAHGLWVTSHEFYPAMAYGADGVEHIRGTSRRGYSPKVSALNRSYGDFTGLLAASGMTLTPTTGIQGTFQLMSARDATYLDDPRFRALFPSWIVESSLRARTNATAGDLSVQAQRLAGLGRTVREVVSRGGRVIAGTDAPIIPFAISLHAELEYYVAGGLSPFEALRTATSWAADALNADVGRVAPGMLADLVIVDGDPLRNIKDARKVRTVLRGGVVYPIEELTRRLSVPRT